MMWNWNGASWWWWFLMSSGMLLFWGVVAVAVLQIMRGTRGPARSPDPEEVLAHRLARGEIDVAEYQERLDTLQGSRSPRAI